MNGKILRGSLAVVLLATVAACAPRSAETDAAQPNKSDVSAVIPAGVGWAIDKSKSRIEFVGVQAGKEFIGAFAEYDIAVAFDPTDLAAAHIKVTIDMASAATGDRQRDDALPSRDWFSAKDFPVAIFESTDVRAASGGYEARGTLTLKGVSKDVLAPFSVDISDGHAVASGEVALIRTDFGVGEGEFATGEWVGLDVKVRFHVEADQ